MGIDVTTADVYRKLATQGRLKIRVYTHWSDNPTGVLGLVGVTR
jgi:hypothetical protein